MPDVTPLHAAALAAIALGVGSLSTASLLAYSVFIPRSQFWAPVLCTIPQRDAIALTFDDGPDDRFTPRILDILAQHNTHATFFVIGQSAKKSPNLLRRISAEGHTLGNHSLDHHHFGVNKNLAYWKSQIDDTQKIIADIIGHPPYLFRPPMGFKTRHIARAAKEAHLPVIAWSLRSLDTRITDPARLAKRTLSKTGGHDIILLHDGVEPGRGVGGSPKLSQEQTVAALPAILEGLAEKELRALTLLEALLPAPAPMAGPT